MSLLTFVDETDVNVRNLNLFKDFGYFILFSFIFIKLYRNFKKIFGKMSPIRSFWVLLAHILMSTVKRVQANLAHVVAL